MRTKYTVKCPHCGKDTEVYFDDQVQRPDGLKGNFDLSGNCLSCYMPHSTVFTEEFVKNKRESTKRMIKYA